MAMAIFTYTHTTIYHTYKYSYLYYMLCSFLSFFHFKTSQQLQLKEARSFRQHLGDDDEDNDDDDADWCYRR